MIPLGKPNSVAGGVHPKKGGLGLIDLSIWNRAASRKVLWNICNKKDSLWVKWVHAIYIRSGSVWSFSTDHLCSWPLKQVISLHSTFSPYFLHRSHPMMDNEDSYSISKAYNVLYYRRERVWWYPLVWCSIAPPKHKFIMWLAIHERLLIMVRLQNLGFLDDSTCVLCHENKEESIQHLFMECAFSLEIWSKVRRAFHRRDAICSWEVEIKVLARSTRQPKEKKAILRAIFVIFVVLIWYERNSRVFRNAGHTPSSLLREMQTSTSYNKTHFS